MHLCMDDTFPYIPEMSSYQVVSLKNGLIVNSVMEVRYNSTDCCSFTRWNHFASATRDGVYTVHGDTGGIN